MMSYFTTSSPVLLRRRSLLVLEVISLLICCHFPSSIQSFVIHHHATRQHRQNQWFLEKLVATTFGTQHQLLLAATPNDAENTNKNGQSLSSEFIFNNNLGQRTRTDDISNNYQKCNISLLLIDHYDSFTYNLYDMISQLTVDPPCVISKDALDGWNINTHDEEDWKKNIDGIILSPGPGTPEEQPKLSHEAISKNPDLPILGVCLGHQLLALQYGATVSKAPKPIHGQDHWITVNTTTDSNNALFQDIPSKFRAVRYHSLAASNLPLDNSLEITAISQSDDVIQGLQHTSRPHYGVQFHPESIGSQYGLKLLENFCSIVQQHKDSNHNTNEEGDGERSEYSSYATSPSSSFGKIEEEQERQPRFRVLLHRLDNADMASNVEPSQVFENFFKNQSTAMWLDSSSYKSGRGTLDIMSAPTAKADIIEYDINRDSADVETTDILTILEQHLSSAYTMDIGIVNVGRDVEWTKDTTVAATTAAKIIDKTETHNEKLSNKIIPFDYRGGYLGYLGYEVRHDTQKHLQEQEACHDDSSSSASKVKSCTETEQTNRQNKKDENSSSEKTIPTAAFFLARESMIYHHPTKQWYLLGLVETEEDVEIRIDWIDRTRKRMNELSRLSVGNSQSSIATGPLSTSTPPTVTFVPNRPKERYAEDIASCHKFIELGESYELCLTNQLEATVKTPCSAESGTTLALYQRLRRKNPAPYSAYIKWNDNLSICCSSPERFMSVQRRPTNNDPYEPSYILQAEAKPIKGTSARVLPGNGIHRSDAEEREDLRRARSLELDLKNRAENLMIVDLLRNDMSRVCEIGSVHVAKLMKIESFATVHQMVSTIRGTLPSSSTSKNTETGNTIDLLRASFPGGSMTGAPKIRAMELLEDLEDDVNRGPYSGSLGYLSINGCMDMNIIIRSAVVVTDSTDNDDDNMKDKKNGERESMPYQRHKVSIGAGGAITALSETENEYDEMLLKARAIVETVQEWAAESSASPHTNENGSSVKRSRL